MPSKDFKGSLNKQRSIVSSGVGQSRIGVVGDIRNPLREELEKSTEQLPIKEIEIERLHDNPFQHLARPVLDEEALKELASSITQNGFYGALLARRKRNQAEQYEIAYGHRRREAARRAGLDTVPVKILDLSDTQMARIMASENFSREDLTPLGESNVVGYLSTAQNMSTEEIAQIIGKKRGWVQPRLALYQASHDIKQLVEQKPEAMSHVRLLTQISNESQRAELIHEILENGLTFEQLRTQLDLLKQTSANTKPGLANIVTSFTNHSIAVDSERSNNVLRETSPKIEITYTEPLLTRDRLQRSEALKRLDKAASKFEDLISKNEYILARDEKDYLKEIIGRLNSILDN